jgi:hypothetical protein
LAALLVGGLAVGLVRVPAAHAAPTTTTCTVTDCRRANATVSGSGLNLDTAPFVVRH